MHIIIIGAGVIGVTSAWYLRQAGYEVTVVDRRSTAGMETSYANGGQISLSHPEPWANPAAPMTLLRSIGRKNTPVYFHFSAEASRWRWSFNFLRECLPWRSLRNTHAIASLAAYSGNALKELRSETQIEYQALSAGVLHLYFNAQQRQHGQTQARILEQHGIRSEIITPTQCIALEPALSNIEHSLHGGLLGVDDESGDAYLFTQNLMKLAAANGVKFVFDTEVVRIAHSGKNITGIHLYDSGKRTGSLYGDAYVIAAGCASKHLMKRLGFRLPVYPLKGYSLTLPIVDTDRAPTISITDESERIVCSRLGQSLRIAGTAEVAGYDLSINPARCDNLLRWAEKVFPGVCDVAQPNYWAGLRPTTPSNVPIIGRSPYRNLYYNTGHGTLGWTLACGSAKALSQIIKSGKSPLKFPFT